MNRAIEFHDSVISAVTEDGGALTLTLRPVILHESSGTPGHDSGRTYRATVTIHFEGYSATNDGMCGGALDTATIWVGSQAHQNMIPVPFQAEGTVVAEFHGIRGGILRVSASAVRVDAPEFQWPLGVFTRAV